MGAGTQYTVNNQMVNATLMNIADNPTNVQLPGVYKNEDIPRVPVVCTGLPAHPTPAGCCRPCMQSGMDTGGVEHAAAWCTVEVVAASVVPCLVLLLSLARSAPDF